MAMESTSLGTIGRGSNQVLMESKVGCKRVQFHNNMYWHTDKETVGAL